MWIKSINLRNFRNYELQKVEFCNNFNVIYGENAQGKTNIIESIYLSSIGKSFRASKDIELIKFNKQSLEVDVNFENKNRDGIVKITIDNKKSIFVNDIKIKKLSQLLGNIHIVIFTPDDINILKQGPQNRRKFLDIMISQLRPNYMHVYNLYLKTLEERNNFLKKIKQENLNDEMLEIWNEQLVKYGKVIAQYRNEFIEKIKNKIYDIHRNITESKEIIEIKYITDCLKEDDFKQLLNSRKKLDIIKGYTTGGIQRDDFQIFINDTLVNVYGSQGQHRTAMLSLKIAELQVVEDEIDEKPILLLDDFMSELDNKRKNNFIQNIKDTQVIITCTEKIKVEDINCKFFKVINGKIENS